MAEVDFTAVIISERKLVDYLLNMAHPEGGAKATFFLGCGFSPDDPSALASGLREHAANGMMTLVFSPFGVKCVIDGRFTGLDGRIRQIRSIWIVEGDGAQPRFVSAYPLEVRRGVR